MLDVICSACMQIVRRAMLTEEEGNARDSAASGVLAAVTLGTPAALCLLVWLA